MDFGWHRATHKKYNEMRRTFLDMPAHDVNNDVIDFVQFDRWLQGLQQTILDTVAVAKEMYKITSAQNERDENSAIELHQ